VTDQVTTPSVKPTKKLSARRHARINVATRSRTTRAAAHARRHRATTVRRLKKSPHLRKALGRPRDPLHPRAGTGTIHVYSS
jgi:uncharacterized protein (DUF924 family)